MKIASLISGCNDYTHLLSIKEHVMREEKPIPTTRKSEVKFLKSLTPLVAAFLVLSPICSIPVSSAQTVDIQRGTTLFRQACIGCHDAGGNIIQPGQLYLQRIYREMKLIQKKQSIVSHTMAKHECQALVKSACHGVSAHLELVWKMKISRHWPSLSSYRLIKGGQV
ncbi:cytochrome c6, chloroplastic-like isoform X1 [Glycine soja]|uniref:Cytochrome c-553 n=2 Tax=Glycine soja TaxID=3848 RepID=A0A445EZQ5_GLYSO|nr:cytochrome c6, chloroplastic-like isoform X1 [Glycine soja]RZB42051.1 Cytochrome c6, chloroplastic [Glycine soja]